jgi:hypothetical protein
MRIRRYLLSFGIVAMALAGETLALGGTVRKSKNYRDDALIVTPEVEAFVARHRITGSDLAKVHRVIEVAHDKFLFPLVARGRMERWLADPSEVAKFRASLETREAELRRLREKRLTALLSEVEDKSLHQGQRDVFLDGHDLKVFEEVIRKKDIGPDDVPFAVSGAEAVAYGITDGCTTAAKTFIVLAQAAGLKETRFVATGNVPDYNLACLAQGRPRKLSVTINGHFFAMVKIKDRWALVNCTYFEPNSEDEEIRYEIFFELDGQAVDPEMMRSRILRVPSFQRDAADGTPGPPQRLYVIGVGKDSRDDLDVENYDALMNLSVSGDRDSPVCRRDPF